MHADADAHVMRAKRRHAHCGQRWRGVALCGCGAAQLDGLFSEQSWLGLSARVVAVESLSLIQRSLRAIRHGMESLLPASLKTVPPPLLGS